MSKPKLTDQQLREFAIDEQEIVLLSDGSEYDGIAAKNLLNQKQNPVAVPTKQSKDMESLWAAKEVAYLSELTRLKEKIAALSKSALVEAPAPKKPVSYLHKVSYDSDGKIAEIHSAPKVEMT